MAKIFELPVEIIIEIFLFTYPKFILCNLSFRNLRLVSIYFNEIYNKYYIKKIFNFKLIKFRNPHRFAKPIELPIFKLKFIGKRTWIYFKFNINERAWIRRVLLQNNKYIYFDINKEKRIQSFSDYRYILIDKKKLQRYGKSKCLFCKVFTYCDKFTYRVSNINNKQQYEKLKKISKDMISYYYNNELLTIFFFIICLNCKSKNHNLVNQT